jgi:hypothetical protein
MEDTFVIKAHEIWHVPEGISAQKRLFLIFYYSNASPVK